MNTKATIFLMGVCLLLGITPINAQTIETTAQRQDSQKHYAGIEAARYVVAVDAGEIYSSGIETTARWGGWGGCKNYDNDDFRNFSSVNNGWASVYMPNNACDTVVSFSSYLLPGGFVRPFDEQVLFDNKTKTLKAGRTYHFEIDLPECGWQSDLYLGSVISHLHPTYGHPGNKIIKWDYEEGEPCSGDGGDTVCIEAEDGDFYYHNKWKIKDNISGTSGSYITVWSGYSSTNSPPGSYGIVEYDFTVNESGNYRVWGRVIAPSGNSDSFWVMMDDGSWIRWNEIQSSSNWVWDEVHDSDNGNQVVNFFLSAGSHTLKIAYREDGTKLDKLIITGEDTVPQGKGDNVCTGDPCIADAGPPEINFSVEEDGGDYIVRVVVTDDTELDEVSYVPDPNLELVNETTGPQEVVYEFRIIDMKENSTLKVSATDKCSNSACTDDEAPLITTEYEVELVFDSNGDPIEDPKAPGLLLFIDGRGTATDNVGVELLDFFFLNNIRPLFFEGDDVMYFGEANPPELGSSPVPFAVQLVDPSQGGQFGAIAADKCNAFIFDPVGEGRDVEPGNTVSAFLEEDGLVVMEAENFTGRDSGTGAAASHEWTPFSQWTASGNAGLHVTPNNGVNLQDAISGPSADYQVYFSTPGTYHLWVLMYGSSDADNSVHVGLNGQPATYGNQGMETNNRWWWSWVGEVDGRPGADQVTVTVDSPGFHTVNVWMREDGVAIDKIVLSQNGSFTPSGSGPAESTFGPAPVNARMTTANEGLVAEQLAVEETPKALTLDENYPNPFNPSTTIRFTLPEAVPVSLTVYDMLGRKVAVLADGVLSAGQHEVQFDASHLASGTYLYRLVTAEQTFVKQMILMK